MPYAHIRNQIALDETKTTKDDDDNENAIRTMSAHSGSLRKQPKRRQNPDASALAPQTTDAKADEVFARLTEIFSDVIDVDIIRDVGARMEWDRECFVVVVCFILRIPK